MKLIERLKDLFGGKASKPMLLQDRIEPIIPDEFTIDDEPGMIKDEKTGLMVETDDPFIAQIVAQTLKSGQTHVGHRDDKGNTKIDKLKP